MASLIAWHILSLKSEKGSDRAFAFFWLFSSGLWCLSGCRLLALALGYPQIDKNIFFGVEFFLGLHIVAGAAFLTLKVFSNKTTISIIMTLASICSLLFIFFSFKEGIARTEITEWTSEHELTRTTLLFFFPVYLYCLIMTVVALLKEIARGLMRADFDKISFFALVALSIYEVAGIIDVQGKTADHKLLIVRSLYMASALTAYFSYSWKSSSIRLVRQLTSGDK